MNEGDVRHLGVAKICNLHALMALILEAGRITCLMAVFTVLRGEEGGANTTATGMSVMQRYSKTQCAASVGHLGTFMIRYFPGIPSKAW